MGNGDIRAGGPSFSHTHALPAAQRTKAAAKPGRV